MQVSKSRRQAFTLIELLVVIAIIAILIGLLLPAVQKVREAAARVQCQNNLKQLSLAMHMYQDEQGFLPTGWVRTAASAPNPGWGWGTLILPYIEQAPLYNALNPNLSGVMPMPAATAQPLLQARIRTFICPSDAGPNTVIPFGNFGKSNYVTNRLLLGPTLGGVPINRTVQNIPDGTSNTIMLGERDYTISVGAIWPGMSTSTASFEGRPGTGMNRRVKTLPPAPTDSFAGDGNCFRLAFTSMHTRICNFAMADGSVHSIRDNIETNPSHSHCDLPIPVGNFLFQNLFGPEEGNVVSGF